MKFTFAFTALCLWLSLPQLVPVEASRMAEPKKVALIIALANYNKRETGWDALSSAKDATLIREMLIKLGFNSRDISLIQDEQATRLGILAALETLENKVTTGDHVIIHYSGHGQQVQDDNGDEFDQRDEALVAFGAFKTAMLYKKAGVPFASLHLRDDELGIYINRIRQKVGSNGHVLVIVDACHAGTITRGVMPQRGAAEPLVAEATMPVQSIVEEGGFGIDQEILSEKGAGGNSGKFVLISASAANQPNYETKDDQGERVGSLTYCLVKALAGIDTRSASYRALFAHVRAIMTGKAPNQVPQIEGDIDYVFLAGMYRPQPNFYNIKSTDGSNIVIDGGRLVGLLTGCRVQVESASAMPMVKAPITAGVVVSSDQFTSLVKLDQSLPSGNTHEYSVFPIDVSFGLHKVQVDVGQVADTKLRDLIKRELQQLKSVELNNLLPDLFITTKTGQGGNSIQILNSNKQPLDIFDGRSYSDAIPLKQIPNALQLIKEVVTNYAQALYTKNVDLKHPAIDVSVALIGRTSPERRDTFSTSQFVKKGGAVKIREGQMVFIKIKNRGTKRAYYNIINISPNGSIYSVCPTIEENINPKDIFIEPGETQVLFDYEITISPPPGIETLKIIASDQPVNITAIINTRSVNETRGGGNSLEKLFGDILTETLARDPTLDTSQAVASTDEFVYQVVSN